MRIQRKIVAVAGVLLLASMNFGCIAIRKKREQFPVADQNNASLIQSNQVIDAANSGAPSPVGGTIAQQVCPVTGKLLGSMGPAIPVMIGDRTVYVCCEVRIRKRTVY